MFGESPSANLPNTPPPFSLPHLSFLYIYKLDSLLPFPPPTHHPSPTLPATPTSPPPSSTQLSEIRVLQLVPGCSSLSLFFPLHGPSRKESANTGCRRTNRMMDGKVQHPDYPDFVEVDPTGRYGRVLAQDQSFNFSSSSSLDFWLMLLWSSYVGLCVHLFVWFSAVQ